MTGELKACCANLYESDLARMLLGPSFHPGGLELTRRLGATLGLHPGSRVLDVACGRGESAVFLAKEFGCRVLGVDLGPQNIAEAIGRAGGLSAAAVEFRIADAEHLDLEAGAFDAIVCECAFCTFGDKPAAAREFARVLRPGGKIGITDLTREGALPPELTDLLAWIACIGDARPVQDYRGLLEQQGFTITAVESQDACLAQMARDIQGRLLGLELMSGINRLGIDFATAKRFANSAMQAIRDGVLGYTLLAGARA